MKQETILTIVNLAIKLLPTIIFLLIVFIKTLTGFLRGYHKSLKSLIRHIIIASIFIVLYTVLVLLPYTDKWLVSLANLIFGESGIQNLLQVSTENETVTQIIGEYISNLTSNSMSVVGEILNDNEGYLGTVVNFVYHIIFFFVLLIPYLIVTFDAWLISTLVHPERKYQDKQYDDYINKKIRYPYRKNRILGAVIGFSRGLVSGVLSLSLLGGIFFVISGDNGTHPLEEIDTNNEMIDFGYELYRDVCSYGNYGIFKILNVIDNDDEVPYYLYLADFVLSGNYLETDENNNKKFYNFNLRKEAGSYVKFTKNALALILEYEKENAVKIINGELNNDELTNIIVELFKKDDFRVEFTNLITHLGSDSFIFDLAGDVIDSLASHLVEVVNFSDYVGDELLADLCSILLTDGYYSENIKNEKILLSAYDKEELPSLPYLKPSYILNKNDLNLLFSVAFIIYDNLETDDILSVVKQIIPYVKHLSLLDGSAKEKFNPVLRRLYAFVNDVYLDTNYSDSKLISISSKKMLSTVTTIKPEKLYQTDDDIDWVNELYVLVDAVKDALVLYNNIFMDIDYAEVSSIMDNVFKIFDQEDELYETNHKAYKNITDLIENSRLLDSVLTSKFVNTLLIDSLSSVVGEYQVPENLSYATTNENKGEFYYLFSFIESIASKENYKNIEKLFSLDYSDIMEEESESRKCLKDVLDFLIKENDDTSALNLLIGSGLLRSISSAFLINTLAKDDGYLYVPSMVLELDSNGNYQNIISKDELSSILFNLSKAFEPILSMVASLQDPDADIFTSVLDLFNSDIVENLLDDPIIQASLGKIFINFQETINDSLPEEFQLIIPASLQNPEHWLDSNVQIGETKNIINALIKSTVFNELIENKEEEFDYMSMLSNVDDFKLMLESKVLYYSVSAFLDQNFDALDLGDFSLIIPTSSKNKLNGDALDYIVRKDEILGFIDFIANVGISALTNEEGIDDSVINDLFANILLNRSKYLSNGIIKWTLASIIFNLSNNETLPLDLPEVLITNGSKEKLLESSNLNPWNKEVNNLFDAIAEICEVGENATELKISFDDIFEKIFAVLENYSQQSIVNPTSTKLNVIYGSLIIQNTFTSRVEELLSDYVCEYALSKAKTNDMFKNSEISALCSLIKISRIDINNFSFDDSLIESLFNNAIRIGDLSYESYLIRGLMSYFLLNETNGQDPYIGSNGYIKSNDKAFEINSSNDKLLRPQESKSLFYLINDLNLNSFDGIEEEVKKIPITILKPYIDDSKGECNSYLMLATITDLISSEIGEIEDETYLKKHPKAYDNYGTSIECLRPSEVSSIIDFLEENANGDPTINNFLNMDYDNISLSNVKKYIGSDNEVCKSYILLASASFQIDANLIDVPDPILSTHPKAYDEIGYLKPLEINSMIDFMEKVMETDNLTIDSALNFDFNDFNIELVKTYILNDDEEVSSYILLSTISNKIMNNAILTDHPSAHENNHDINSCLKPQEIVSLIDFLKEASNLGANEVLTIEKLNGLSANDFDDFNIGLLSKYLSDDRGNCSSYLLLATISKRIESSLINISTPVLVNHSKAYKDGFLKNNEIVTLIDLLLKDNNSVTIKTIGNNSNTFTSLKIADLIEIVGTNNNNCKSFLLLATISNELQKQIGNASDSTKALKTDSRAYEIDGDKYFLKVCEVNSLLSLILDVYGNNSTSQTVSSLNDNSYSLSTVKKYINEKSYIITSTVSSLLRTQDSILVIPQNVCFYDNEANENIIYGNYVIGYEEIRTFFDALESMNRDSFQNMGSNNIVINKNNLGYITKSKILNATISSQIKFNNGDDKGNNLYVKASNVTPTIDIRSNNNVLIISELYNFLDLFMGDSLDNSNSSFSINLSLDSIREAAQNGDFESKYLDSCSITRYMISDMLSDPIIKNLYILTSGKIPSVETNEVYQLGYVSLTEEKEVLTKDSIIDMLKN